MWAPALATQPVPITFTLGPQKRIMSWMVSPLSTWPPGELMITRISLSFSAASAVSWAVTRSAMRMSTSPNTRTVRDLKSAFCTGPEVIGMSGLRPFSSSSPSSSSSSRAVQLSIRQHLEKAPEVRVRRDRATASLSVVS